MNSRYRVLVATLLSTLCLASGSALAQTVTMKLSTSTSGDAINEWMRLLKQGIEARAPGKMKVEIYPASQLARSRIRLNTRQVPFEDRRGGPRSEEHTSELQSPC